MVQVRGLGNGGASPARSRTSDVDLLVASPRNAPRVPAVRGALLLQSVPCTRCLQKRRALDIGALLIFDGKNSEARCANAKHSTAMKGVRACEASHWRIARCTHRPMCGRSAPSGATCHRRWALRPLHGVTAIVRKPHRLAQARSDRLRLPRCLTGLVQCATTRSWGRQCRSRECPRAGPAAARPARRSARQGLAKPPWPTKLQRRPPAGAS
jgi:hypothetical protein